MVIVYFYGNGIYYCHKRQSAIYLMLLKGSISKYDLLLSRPHHNISSISCLVPADLIYHL